MNKYIVAGNKIKSTFIKHRIAQEKLKLLFASAALSSSSEMIFLPGMPRAGKSTLLKEVRKLLNPPGIEIDSIHSNSVGVRASNCSTNGAFSTKSFAKMLINELKHPIHSDNARDMLGTQEQRDQYESDMWHTIENTIKATNKKYVCIDEAQNICRARGKSSPGAILDSWKCFSESTGTILLVGGTYEILTAILQASHVIGRQAIVHYPPYLPNELDLMEFKDIINTFDQFIPRHHSLSYLENHLEFLFKGSLGCVGLLSRWLRNALSHAMASDSDLTMNMLLKSRLSDSNLNILEDELRVGFELLKNTDLSNCVKGGIDQVPDYQAEQVEKGLGSDKEQEGTKKARKKKPFTSNPKRREAGERVQGEVCV